MASPTVRQKAGAFFLGRGNRCAVGLCPPMSRFTVPSAGPAAGATAG